MRARRRRWAFFSRLLAALDLFEQLLRFFLVIRVEVEAERFSAPGNRVRVTEAEVVYVAIGENGKATSVR